MNIIIYEKIVLKLNSETFVILMLFKVYQLK